MRTLLACLLLVAACGGDDAAEPAPDAAVPYSLTWTCMSSCDASRPELTDSTTLAVDGLTLTYDGGAAAVHVATAIDGSCLDVPAQAEPQRQRQAYQLCGEDGTAEATIVWSLVGIPTAWATWRLTAQR